MSALRERPAVADAGPLAEEALRQPQRSPAWGRLVAGLAGAALVAALSLFARDVWAAQAVGVGLLLTLPGLALLRALRVPGHVVKTTPVYVPASALVVVTAAGLALNLIGPEVGIERPLRRDPLLVTLALAYLPLLVASLSAPRGCDVGWDLARVPWHRGWPLLLPILSAAGAMRLNAGHGNELAIVAAVAAIGALAASVSLASRMTRAHLTMVLFGAGLALLWSFSLRGNFVYGFDISNEFFRVAKTTSDGIWPTLHRDDAYGAMLSLSVFPATLSGATGISVLALLKVAYPLLFAAGFPVMIFALASRFVHRRWAFAAATLVVVQAYFFQQMPTFARQEIALLLLATLVGVVFDDRLHRRGRWTLTAGLALGVVVCHYSTTYLAIATLVGAISLQFLVSLARPIPRVTGALVVAFLALSIGAGVWYAGVTKSTSNASNVSSDVRTRGLDLLPNAKPGQNIVQSYLVGNQQQKVTPQRYQRLVAREFREDRPYVKPWAAGSEERYRITAAKLPAPRVHFPALGQAVQSSGLALSQALNVIAVAGALFLAFSKRTPPALRGVAVLGVSTLGAMAFLRLSGTAANAYNQERAFLQMMIPMSVAVGFALQAGWRFLHRVRVAQLAFSAMVAAAVLVVGFNNAGLRGGVFGGSTPTSLANAGEDYERFYITRPEMAAATWLHRVPTKEPIYSDRYGKLRISAALGRYDGVFQDVTPPTLDRHAWVYRGAANTRGRTRGETRGRFTLYRWPGRYLRDHYNAVYNNGTSGVYHR